MKEKIDKMYKTLDDKAVLKTQFKTIIKNEKSKKNPI